MTQTTGKILKSSQVSIEGKYQVGFSHANHNSPENLNSMPVSPKVKIIENNEGYVVIQVTCSCGQQINLRGEYKENHKS
jgi:hypothetical protein